MTLTEIALMSPRLARLSRISCCAAGSPDGGLRKTTSTPTSPAALLHPFSTMDQNGSGLLLTKATLGFVPDEAAPPPAGLGALHAGIVISKDKDRRERRVRCMASSASEWCRIGRHYRESRREMLRRKTA